MALSEVRPGITRRRFLKIAAAGTLTTLAVVSGIAKRVSAPATAAAAPPEEGETPSGVCPDVVPTIDQITPDQGTAGGEASVNGRFNPTRGLKVEFGRVISDTAPYAGNTLENPVRAEVLSVTGNKAITVKVPQEAAGVKPIGVRIEDCGGTGPVHPWSLRQIARRFLPFIPQ